EEALKLYPATTREEVIASATDLASDRFIGYSTWKWSDLHARTGGSPVYRYFYARPRPAMNPTGNPTGNPTAPPPAPARGAVHSAEIEYALGNLSTNKVYAWTPDDYKVSKLFEAYFANFVKRGDPNGPGLPAWPAIKGGAGADAPRFMLIDVDSRAETDAHRARQLFLERLSAK
ncbi:MAG TPA: carboxylesterase family protein, partial [Pyrinomonadaceae bacterium]|nr:carboxylesterase family protein [Pyrinomonadaceae bacterium]